MKQIISTLLQQAIVELYDIELSQLQLDTPPDKNLWDIAFGCFVLAKQLKQSPMVIASQLAEACQNIVEFSQVMATGPYLNISLSDRVFVSSLEQMRAAEQSTHHWKTIVVDYIGANVGKPLHIGHMCTPNQGQVMINVYKKLWYNVISDSHIWDWGIIFWKLITAYKKWGDPKKLEINAVDHLFELYVQVSTQAKQDESLDAEFRKEFKSLVQGENQSIDLWSLFTRHSIDAMNHQLARMNIQPDYDIGESFYEGIGLPKMWDYPDLQYSMSSIVDELIAASIATKNEDHSVGVVFADDSKLPSCILQKRDGWHGYLASDLASVKYRVQNWAPEKIIYFVDVRQQLHLKQVFEVSQQAWWTWDTKLIHAHNGFISLKDGAMSTREGRIIRLEALLDESALRAKKLILTKRSDLSDEQLTELSKTIWIGAIKYGYLKKSRESDIIFDWDEFMSFEGNSGPYLQYACVRAHNILKKADFSMTDIPLSPSPHGAIDTSEKELIQLLSDYENCLIEVADKNMPHILCSYLYDLTKAFSSMYTQVHILWETDELLREIRLHIVAVFYRTLKDGLALLAIEVPEKM